MTATWTAVAALAVGYVLGRARPLRRISDWANWQKYGHPTGLRYAAVWTVLSAENIGWLLAHPVRGWHAWQHRNDPPQACSAPIRVDRIPREQDGDDE